MAFHKRAVFSDMTSDYLSPCEPKKHTSVTVKIRVGKNNADRVVLISGNSKAMMKLSDSDELFDYYQYVIHLEEEKVSYYFEICAGQDTYYYDRRGIIDKPNAYYNFCIIPGFHTPDWAKGAVMYQIFVDRFYNGDLANDVIDDEYAYIKEYVKKVDVWENISPDESIRAFYGGDLQGIMDKMDYLRNLGVDVIYLNPIFVSPSNHKYDIQDYEHIDPHFGKIVEDEGDPLMFDIMDNREASKYIERTTNLANLEASDALFESFIKEAHKRGIKVILDGVFNHCGSFNKWLDREGIYAHAKDGYAPGAYWQADSPYHDYFKFEKESTWPKNTEYESWWGFDTLPKLNYEESEELCQKILEIGKKWVSEPYCADGWRLDVAADLGHSVEFNHKFWQRFRDAVKSANPDALILAEHYGPSKDWLQGNEWDGVMNYDAFMEPITWFLTGMEKHSDEYRKDMYNNATMFWSTMETAQACFPQPSVQVAMNELSNHDHSRFLTRTNHRIGRLEYLNATKADEDVDRAVMREAVLMQMTWPGAPTIYYGDEAGLCGFTDPDNRRPYPWGKEDQELISFHKEMIRIHKENPEMKQGSMKKIASIPGILGYGRFNEKEQSLILINNGDTEAELQVTVWEIGVPAETVMKRIMLTNQEGFTLENKEYEVNNGKLTITVEPKSAVILKHVKKDSTIKQKKWLHF